MPCRWKPYPEALLDCLCRNTSRTPATRIAQPAARRAGWSAERTRTPGRVSLRRCPRPCGSAQNQRVSAIHPGCRLAENSPHLGPGSVGTEREGRAESLKSQPEAELNIARLIRLRIAEPAEGRAGDVRGEAAQKMPVGKVKG